MGSKHLCAKAVSLFVSCAGRKIKTLLFFLFILFISTTSFAQDFTAKFLGDYGNVTVMEVTGNYDADNPDGTVNAVPRQAIAQQFFKTHKDEYDFLVIFTNFDFQMPAKEVDAFYTGVKNDTQGIGVDMFDNTNMYGSNGKLQGTVDMGNLARVVSDPLDPKFEKTLSIMSHELMHRWAAHAVFKDATGSVSSALLGLDGAHWSFLLDSGGSVMYGNVWQDNGNGRFTTTTPQGQMKSYSLLDQYLMGMVDKSKVPPMLLINSPGTAPTQLPQAGITITGAAQYLAIDQIIAAMGTRIPDASTSQKNFKTAFILAAQPGTFTGQELYGIENIRSGQVTRFSVLTNGKGIVEVASTPKDNIPVNPGVFPPSTMPRTLPPNINDGVQWLGANQKPDGSWIDLGQTTERDTAEGALALKNFTTTQSNYLNGLQWLGGISSGNMDFLSRKIQASAGSGTDLTALMNELLSRQNPDGGWGSNRNYPSNPVDTALALKALSVSGYSGQQVVAQAIGYLKNVQNTDGGWGTPDMGSTVQETSNVLSAFNQYRSAYQLDDAIMRGTTSLVSKQNSDGGFGNSTSTVYDTARAAMTLGELNVSGSILSQAVGYILSRQSDNGSWNQSAYQTALALEAVYKATVDPDLSIKPEDISFIPVSVTSLPANVVINANIWNLGVTSVPQAKVVLFDGNFSTGTKIGEQLLAFPGQASTTVTFSAVVNDGNEHLYTIVVDPDNLIKESNKLNNTTGKALYSPSTYDFEVLSSDIALSVNPANMLQDVTITSKITNKGTINAYNVQVRYYIDDPVSPFEIATQTIDIPLGATVANQTTWHANKAGINMPLSVLVDPFNNFNELSKTNNKATTTITVNGATAPNLSVSYKDMVITPRPANQGGNATIMAVIKNDGFSSASNVKVNFYEGVPGADGVLIGSQIIPIVNPGDNIQASINWTNIQNSGEKIIFVKADPDNQITEIRKDDNDAFTSLTILTIPDLAVSANSIIFTPAAPKEGDPVTILVTVQNRGEQAASNVNVRFFEGDVVLGNKIIPALAGNATGTASLAYDTTGKKGTHTITATADPDNLITERSKNNNSASNTFGVQDSNLWVTEPYFSPNGDDVKDSTQFFFRFAGPTTVTVSAINGKGEIVRTFSGPDLTNITAGTIVWDGLNNDGMVVPDGPYQLQVKGVNNTVLGSLLVTVDTNRSPLSDAFGTKYLLNNNLTCMLTDISDWKWFPNESGILTLMPFDPNTPEYPYGLYTISPDGQDIMRISPWTAGIDPVYDYSYPVYDISPDSEKVAFILNRYNKSLGITELQQLWAMDPYGQNMVKLESYDAASKVSLLYFKWSPLSDYIVYRTQKAGAAEELWFVRPDGTGKRRIDSNGYFDSNYMTWSPDNSNLAYVFGIFDANGNYSGRIRILDISSSNTRDVFTVADPSDPDNAYFTDYLRWLSNHRIVLDEYGYSYGSQNSILWLIDTTGNGNHVTVGEGIYAGTIALAPDRKSFVFTEDNFGWNAVTGSIITQQCDPDGNTTTLHDLAFNGDYCVPQQSSIVWSPDSKKIVFSEGIITNPEYSYDHTCSNPLKPEMAVVEVSTKSTTTYSNSMVPFAWLSDGVSIAGYVNSVGGTLPISSICALNAASGESKCSPMGLETWLPNDPGKYLSPQEHYFTYYQSVDQFSVCYERGWSDLWAMSSLLNLAADLRPVQSTSAMALKGIAADHNFDSYKLDYADIKNPASWSPVVPPSDVPVINDVFTTWIPSYEGTFYVRLTVSDEAGNTTVDRKRVSWGQSSNITNIYTTLEIFSPNNDGVKDTVELHYSITGPMHLELYVNDEDNNRIRTFTKDYALPSMDYISWDGKDESGNTVPDGKYTITVLDYEFFVTADNTPPDVKIDLSSILFNQRTGDMSVSLAGLAFDKNIKNWTIEYGQGENPQSWSTSQQRSSTLAATDRNGILLSPLQETLVATYVNADLGNIRGQKLRITAEDFAGNISTSMSGFVNEGIFISDPPIPLQIDSIHGGYFEYIPDDLSMQGSHNLLRGVTVRNPLTMLVLQEKIGQPGVDPQWVDMNILSDPDMSSAGFQWVNTQSSFLLSAIRLKGVDTLGREFYSNELSVPYFYLTMDCYNNVKAFNSYRDSLTTLKFQVDRGEYIDEQAWQDYLVWSNPSWYDHSGESLVIPPTLNQGQSVFIRMVGTIVGSGGGTSTYKSAPVLYPSQCLTGVILNVIHDEGSDCGQLSSGMATLVASLPSTEPPPIPPTGLSYFMDTPQGTRLLKKFDLTHGAWGSVTVNTVPMSEGQYPVKAVLEYADLISNATQSTSASGTLVVDRVLPTALLTYPTGTSLKFCPLPQHGPKGDWFGISVEAVAADNTAVARYELYYGVGDNPLDWFPATDPTKVDRFINPIGQISGKGPVKGRIGIWDVSSVIGGTYTLKLKVVDAAGNVSCSFATFSFDSAVDIVNLTTDNTIISPNGDGVFDTANVGYEIDKYATVDVKVFPVLVSANGSLTLGPTKVRTLATGIQHLGGNESIVWDGKSDAGAAVPDGLYAVTIYAVDACGNTAQSRVIVAVDNTPPSVFIAYPKPGDPIGNIVEVKGSAIDPHFQSYTLEAGQGSSPNAWSMISSGMWPINNNIFGKWNTFGLTETWTLRLTAYDTVGNKNFTTDTIDLGTRKNLIKNLGVLPEMFSPNGDGKLDTTTVTYELADACNVVIEFLDANSVVRRTISTTVPSLGIYTFVWDGKDVSGTTVPDGAYTVRLTAVLSSNTSMTQTETVTAVVDTTLPMVDIKQPLNNSYTSATNIVVSGTISDISLSGYTINNGAAIVDQANQSRTNYDFGTLNGLPEGNYTLTAKATDQAQNETNTTIAFTIDRTPPAVKLDTPTNGVYYGTVVSAASATAVSNQPLAIVNITGSILEKNLDTFNLRYGLGDNPAQWTDLTTGTTVTAYPSPFAWKVGKTDGIPDGRYMLSLYGKDKAGLTGETKVKITIDNTPPTTAITSLHDGDYVKQPIDVKGTAFDQNLDTYSLDMSEGQCASAFKWATIKTGAASVQDNVLGTWQALPPDGDYCLLLTAIDKVGSSSEAKVNVKVDTHPPAAPVLSGTINNKTNISLTWTANTELDLAGYNLYRNGQKVNTALIIDTRYLDQNLAEGVYSYTVSAVNVGGLEGKASNSVSIKIDLTGPNARIASPQDGARVSGLDDIKGTAYSADDFKQYRVSIGQGAAVPTTWALIRTSPVPISYGVLSPWDTLGLAEGQVYSIKLETEDLSGNITTHQISVTIDNTPPAAPVLISASAIVSDVTVTWKANTEADLAGYLLYRNDRLTNVTGIVVGNLQSYLIKGTSYVDKSLPDGTFMYYLIAMDQAGNISNQSNTLSVTIDTHPPHATISDPQDKAAFEKKIMVKAQSPDLDIASVQFQYQGIQSSPTTSTDWLNLGGLVTSATLVTYLDPSARGLVCGDFRLRAVAMDKGNKTDPAPGFITITYTDLTPPTSPVGLTALVTGGTVTLTWKANAESDLAGYNVYRTSGGTRTKINNALIAAAPQPTSQDTGLADDTYIYDVTAIDTHQNESKPSIQATATIYAPAITQPYTPTGRSAIQILGTNAGANAIATLSASTASGLMTLGTATVAPSGTFTINAVLIPGENQLSARATDNAGNTSKNSGIVVVVYDVAPGVPTGAAAVVNGSNINLTWDPNPEPAVLGYNVYRDGVKVNKSDALAVATTAVSASTSLDPYQYTPEMAIDSSLTSYWMPQNGTSIDNPAWWEMDLPSPELISHVEVHWGTDVDASGNQIVYAGKDYEIQVWSGYAWITQVKVTGNMVKDNIYDFKPSYRTDRIRIYITDSTDINSAKQIRLAEVTFIKDNPVLPTGGQPGYDDLNLPNKQYGYAVTAVDNYGFESQLSSLASATVGVAPPSAPTLTATALISSVTLTWTASPEPSTTGYNVYKSTIQGWNKIGSTPFSATSYLDAGLLNGMYAYRVTAVDGLGNESPASNEATVTIAVTPPGQPSSLGVSPSSQGGLNASWVYNGSPAAGFNLYRSQTTGGPYTKINNSLITGNVFLDTNVTSSVTYYYVVTAVDIVGNQGVYSNEASGTPPASAPVKPVIFFPALAGLPITVFGNTTDIYGSAAPGSSVSLTGNGTLIGMVSAQTDDSVRNVPLNYDGNGAALSPDGNTLAYTNNNTIWLMSLATGSVTQAVQAPGCYTIVWSPDSSKIAYCYNYDSSGDNRINIYDVTTGSSSQLTSDTLVYEGYPSWSADGNKVVFLQQQGASPGIWSKDIISGIATQVIATTAAFPMLSPDGTKLAYFNGQSLYLYDPASNANQLIDDNTDGYALEWSPDGKMLAFVSYRDGSGELFLLNVAGGTQMLVPGSSGDPYYPVWTADGQHILFDIWDSANNRDTVWTADADGQTSARRILPDLHSVWYIGSAKTGAIAVIDQNAQGAYSTELLSPKGIFTLSAASLAPGENIFTATATNSTGNISDPSDPVSVIFDTRLIPDLAVSPDDIYLYPPCPIAGDQMAVNAVVWNSSQVDISNVDVAVYFWNAFGHLEMLVSETIPTMAAGSSTLISATWDSTGKTGNNRLVIVVDTNDKIAELNKSNNTAIKDFYVADHVGISMNTSTDQSQYSSNQDTNMSVTIWNTGPTTNAMLNVRIEDTKGNQVKAFDSQAVSLAYGNQSVQNVTWNTGSTYAGSYVVHAILSDGSGTTRAENKILFTIVSDAIDDLAVTTDKISYGPNENVLTSFTIKNDGTNYMIPDLQATVAISDATGTILFSEVKNISNLMPGTAIDLSSSWNTGLMVPGIYNATVTVTFYNGQPTTKSVSFTIQSLLVLTGNITASPSIVSIGNTEQLTYTVANSGNTDALGYTARISIIDPQTQVIVQSQDQPVDIPENSSKSGMATVSTNGYSLKTYRALLQLVYQDTIKNIASASFTVKDLSPPVVTIVSPQTNGSYNSTVILSALAADNASGVDSVEYQIDSESWNILPLADSTQGRYATTWNPAVTDNGSHIVSFRATDKAGNTSIPVPVGFMVRSNTPSVGSIVINNGEKYTNNSVVILTLSCTSTSSVCAQMAFSSDAAVWSAPEAYGTTKMWQLIYGDGMKTVYVRYTDGTGITSAAYSASITLDTTAPALTLSTLADGSLTHNATLNIAGTATDNIAVQGVTINNMVVQVNPDGTFSQAISLVTGTNTITTIATDTAGNTTTDTRTIILDQTMPVITITNPVDNSVTNIESPMVTGTVDKTAMVSVQVNSGSPVPATMTGNGFNLPVTLTYGQNTIQVTATDLTGNIGTAKRTVTFDNINPVLAVTYPAQDIATNQSSITLQGTVSDIASTTVTITMDGVISTPTVTAGTFQQTLMFAAQKIYAVIVTATDAAGNTTTVQRNVIYDTTPPAVTINPVTTPTNQPSQTVIGTMDANATVNIICPTAAVGLVTYPTTTTWRAALTNMTEGSNTVSVTATDQAGNVSNPANATIVLDTIAPDTILQTDPAALTNQNTTSFSFISTKQGSTFECKLDTTGYASCASPMNYNSLIDGMHTFMVRATDPAGNTDPTPAIYAWKVDTIPPVAVITGAPSSLTNARSASLAVTGDDVTAYKYHLDFGVFSAENSVSTPIILSGLLDGTHTVFVVGKDSAGNWQSGSNATVATWTVDITPPVLILSTLGDGSYTNNPVLNIAGTARDANGIQSVVVSGQTVTISTSDNVNNTFSQAVSLATGSNKITTVAKDNAGNTTMDTRTVILDQTAPQITITNPADNSLTNKADVDVTGTVDKTATIFISLNSGPAVTAATNATIFSLPVTLAYNVNHIEVTAVDLANNPGAAKRTVTLDNLSPALAITNPNQDMGTNQAGITISGTVSDLTNVTMLVTCPTASIGVISTPTSTTWSVNITNMQQGTNAVTVQATDQADNRASVVRNIIYSSTPITIDPVKTPTNNSQQQITGTMELVSMVTVSCSTATVGMITYPTTTTWQMIIAGMTEGANIISATATDLEGKPSSPVTATIVLDIHAPVTTPSPAPGAYYNTVTATLTANEPATIYYTIDGTTPTATSAVYNGPLLLTATTTLKFFAVNMATNAEAIKSAAYTVIPDTEPPVTTITAGTLNYTSDDGKLYVTSSSKFTLSAADNISGVATIGYRLDGGTWTTYASAFSLVTEGSHTIGYRSTDNAANVEIEKSLGTVVNNTPPVSTISIGVPPVTVSTAITLTATDSASGVKLTEYNIDGSAWNTYTRSFTLATYSQGTHTINYRSTDNIGNVETPKTRTVKLWTDRPTITTTALVDGTAGASYSQTLAATGGTAPYLWSISTGTLPGGLLLNNTTGAISGTTLSAGTATITFQAADANNMTNTKVLSLTLYGPVSITTSALASSVIGSSYSQTLSATGGKTPYVWSIFAGSLPSGLLLNNLTGVISGTLISAGTSTFTVQAKDANNAASTKPLSIAIYAPLTISTVLLPTGTTGVAYSQTLAATGGLQPYVWSTTTGTLPAGLSLNSSTGIISGTSSSAGTSTFTAQVKDANNVTSSKVLAITINSVLSIPQNIGVFGATGVSMSGGYVDSYDSTQGSYNGTHGPNVSVGTNSTANGAITLSGRVVDYGNAYVGPGGNPAKAITTSGSAVIYGSKGALSALKSMTPKSDPGGGTRTTFTNGTTLTSGTYRVSSINLSGSGKGTINGNVTLYVTGSVKLSGSSQIMILPGGSLNIYLDGSLNVSGGAIVNQTLNPHNLTIYGTSICTAVSYSGSGAFYGVIYTPAASTTISGGVNVYGAVIGGSIAISGGAAVHYDASLGNIGN